MIDGAAVRDTGKTAYQPDGLVYRGPSLPPDAREVSNPIVVVEVLSASTAARDATRKIIGYFSPPSVVHYLILDAEARAVIHHKRGEAGVVEIGSPLLDPPGREIAVADLFPSE